MSAQIDFSLPRSFSTLSSGWRTKDNTSDDKSVLTFSTDAPVKYIEASKFRFSNHFKAGRRRSTGRRRGTANEDRSAVGDDDSRSAQIQALGSFVEERDCEYTPPSLRRASSFQGLQEKVEKISFRSFRKQRQHGSCLGPQQRLNPRNKQASGAEEPTGIALPFCSVETMQLNSKLEGNLVEQGPTAETIKGNEESEDLKMVRYPQYANNKLCYLPEGTVSFQSASLPESNQSFDDDTDEFLGLLGSEIHTAYANLPKDHKELVLFLGDEFEASACGNVAFKNVMRKSSCGSWGDSSHSMDNKTTTSSKNNSNITSQSSTCSVQLASIEEDGPLEEILESIETSYEASLVGCGMITAPMNYSRSQ